MVVVARAELRRAAIGGDRHRGSTVVVSGVMMVVVIMC